jgi:hypothetical protein
MPSQDVIPHHPCSGSASEPFFKVLKDSPENFRDLSILSDCDTDESNDPTFDSTFTERFFCMDSM